MAEIPLSRDAVYGIQLRKTKNYYKVKDGILSLPEADSKGFLSKKFVIIECLKVNGSVVYLCSCDSHARKSVKSAITRGLHFDHPASCIHVEEAQRLWSEESIDLGQDDISSIYQLTDTLFCAYSDATETYGIVLKCPRSVKCVTCLNKVTSCCHVRVYNDKAQEHGFNIPMNRSEDMFQCVSSHLISYPLDDSDANLFGMYAANMCQYPYDLVPSFEPGQTCVHGNPFDNRDPCEEGWIISSEASIYTKHATNACITYYRPVVGNCECRAFYDGRADLLLNLDNKHIFTYTWLFDILHDTQETRYPLAAAFRSANRTRSVCGLGPLSYPYMYNNLRVAYNCFLRLLDLDFQKLFACDQCGTDVECLIMDGIMMGSRKDLLPNFETPDKGQKEVPECSISERVFIHTQTTRKLLASYAAINRGKYGKCQTMSTEDFNKLCTSLKTWPSLQKLVKQAGKTCPKSHQVLLGELSRGSPTCGIFQIQDSEAFCEVGMVLDYVAQGERHKAMQHCDLIMRDCPLLYDIITAPDVHDDTLASLIRDLLQSINSPFMSELPSQDCYGEPSLANEVLEFFPNHALHRGRGNYKADRSKDSTHTGCRKETQRHATLTPGLFTIFCPHGICLGFQIMESVESPRTAFDIITRRFNKVPSLVIYDNSCKLHLYCLKREPKRFEKTRFLVDRLHYRKGHVGCSLGYSMDSYTADNYIVNINSQTNEQANASLRRLATQLAYMPPDNVMRHTAVFLALRNLDKML